MTLEPGTRFGRFEVVAEIASGGMATVFLSRALGAAGFQRLVAIKLMHPHHAKDPDFVTMFMDEARLAARIRHPNVVATLDLQNDDDGLYLVMEYVEGDVLMGLLRDAARKELKVPSPIGVRILLDTLGGLHAAHELTDDRGEPLRLVHRDVSPHNVLVGTDGIARITDFGIARAEARLGGTRDGQVKGKLAYMAPEQTTAGPIDRRADVFAAGVVLWETLAGQRLLHGASDGEILRNLLVNKIPRLKTVRPDLPDALDEVCARALERDPESRFSTAGAFADALEDAAGAIGIASSRAVAQYVREHAGEKLAQMKERIQGLGPVENTGSGPIRRRKENTDPERTVRRDEGVLLGVGIGVGTSNPPTRVEGRPGGAVPPPAPGSRPLATPTTEASATADAALPEVDLGLDLEDDLDAPPVRRSKRGVWIVALVAIVAAGGVAAYAATRNQDRNESSDTRSTPAPNRARTSARATNEATPPPPVAGTANAIGATGSNGSTGSAPIAATATVASSPPAAADTPPAAPATHATPQSQPTRSTSPRIRRGSGGGSARPGGSGGGHFDPESI